jgi:hypothetical protein
MIARCSGCSGVGVAPASGDKKDDVSRYGVRPEVSAMRVNVLP